jgi:hypothetical protein
VARFLVFLYKTKAQEAILMGEYINDRAEVRSTESDGIYDVPSVSDRDRRPIRILIIGQPSDVVETIKNLHSRGFAPVGHWSRPDPWLETESGVRSELLNLPETSVMSVCTKYLL